MFTSLELFIGQRYTHSRRRNRFISFISFASMLGIMIGVMVLITILSIMNGFERELRDRILGVVAHVTISGSDKKLADWETLAEQWQKNPAVTGAAPYVRKQVMLSNQGKLQGVLLQGIDPAYQDQVSELNFKLLSGEFSDLSSRGYGITLGADLAETLQVTLGDKVTLIVPKVRVTPAGLIPRLRRFTVIGIHAFGMKEYDSMTAFVHIEDAARLLSLKDQVTGVRLKLDDFFAAPRIAHELQTTLGEDFEVKDWTKENGSFFRAIKTEKIAMSLILFLVVAVALFNLVASLVMTVKDKEADIAILRTFGMESGSIRRIFMIQGSIIGIFGSLVGALCGVLLSLYIDRIVPFFENLFGRKIFPEELFYISEVPSELDWSSVFWITVLAMICSVLATLYPSWRAAAIQPAESLRYE